MIPKPRSIELSFKAVWQLAKEVLDIMEHFPSLYSDELPIRAFMWAIYGILRSEAFKSLLFFAKKACSSEC